MNMNSQSLGSQKLNSKVVIIIVWQFMFNHSGKLVTLADFSVFKKITMRYTVLQIRIDGQWVFTHLFLA